MMLLKGLCMGYLFINPLDELKYIYIVLYFHFAIICLNHVQFSCSVMSDSLQPHEPLHARPPCLSPTLRGLPKLMSIESVMPSNHLILCCPLLLLPTMFPNIRVFLQ